LDSLDDVVPPHISSFFTDNKNSVCCVKLKAFETPGACKVYPEVSQKAVANGVPKKERN
jgi:hypothetical protein